MLNTCVIDFKILGDERGQLIALEQQKNIPFDIKRVYYIFETQKGVRRGFHAHKALEQVLVCVNGSCDVLIDNGQAKKIISLNRPDKGLYIGPMIWREMFDFSEDCVLMVLASEHYDEADYIRDYKQYLEWCGK